MKRGRPSRSLAVCTTESARILAEARAEADAIISRTRADAARAGEELKQKARADAENIVKHAEREIRAGDVAGGAEDPAGSGRHLDRHRVEDHPAQSHGKTTSG